MYLFHCIHCKPLLYGLRMYWMISCMYFKVHTVLLCLFSCTRVFHSKFYRIKEARLKSADLRRGKLPSSRLVHFNPSLPYCCRFGMTGTACLVCLHTLPDWAYRGWGLKIHCRHHLTFLWVEMRILLLWKFYGWIQKQS